MVSFFFTPYLGKMNPFWRAYFSHGLVKNHHVVMKIWHLTKVAWNQPLARLGMKVQHPAWYLLSTLRLAENRQKELVLFRIDNAENALILTFHHHIHICVCLDLRWKGPAKNWSRIIKEAFSWSPKKQTGQQVVADITWKRVTCGVLSFFVSITGDIHNPKNLRNWKLSHTIRNLGLLGLGPRANRDGIGPPWWRARHAMLLWLRWK